jgi:alpha-tubulin suppressor-like RCC1 family protein
MKKAEETPMNYKLLWKSIGFLIVFSVLAIISGCGNCHNGDESGTASGEESTLSVSISSPPRDFTVNQGQAVNVQGKVTGGTAPYTYLWEFGNGVTSDLKDPGFILFDTPGTFTIKLTVTDSKGLTGSASVNIIVLDITPPTVISTIPVDGELGVDTHAPVSVTFSEDMDPETLTNTTFTVSAGGMPVPGTIEVSGDLAVFTPASPLIQGVVYTATVTTGAQDLQGNPLASDYTWTFTTLKSIAGGVDHTLVIGTDGSLWAWGSNASGQLGFSSAVTVNVPQQVMPEITNWAAISAGKAHSVGLKKDGSLWAWGSNAYGQLGVAGSSSPIPKQIEPGTKWIMVSAGWYHTLAIKADGSLWAWGLNENGQAGAGSGISKSTVPVRIGQTNDWLFVAAGLSHNIVIKKDGSLWTWGSNSAGQLGNGDASMANQYAPVLIDSGKWVTAAAGCVIADTKSHSMAVKSDGSLWTWGWNQYGQLGDQTYINKLVPVQVGNELNWMSVSAGGRHSLALKNNGSLWAFGYNASGQLGDGSYTTRNMPVPVTSEWAWAAIATGNEHSVGLGTDGTVYTWGKNNSGQLGDGSYTGSNIPLQITDQNY